MTIPKSLRRTSLTTSSGLRRPLRRMRFFILIALVCGVLAPATPAHAKKKLKPSRTVTGVVLDQSENPLSGAVVNMKDVQTGKELSLYTQSDGRYSFTDLNPDHDYQLQASYKGDKSEMRTASSFDTRNDIVLNLHIPPPKDEEN